MHIGQAARLSGVSAKMIRHYEASGIAPAPQRTEAGYRIYSETDVHLLRFIKRARGLGFTSAEIKKLVSLWRNRSRASAQVKALAAKHLAELDRKIAELSGMAAALRHLVKHCQGDDRPDCPILEDLSRSARSFLTEA